MPMLIGICGSGSGSGKTTLAEELLKSLTGGPSFSSWGAIKFTKTSVYTSVVTDPNVLLREGKDTARMLGAGARAAAWVQSPGGEDLGEALSMAMENLKSGLKSQASEEGRPLEGIIVEGNSAVELLKPDIVIFMCGPSFKEGSEAFLFTADVVCSFARGPRHKAFADRKKGKKTKCCGDIKTCVSQVLMLISNHSGFPCQKGQA